MITNKYSNNLVGYEFDSKVERQFICFTGSVRC